MSVKDLNKTLIVTDTLTGQVIMIEPMYDGFYSYETLMAMLNDIIRDNIWINEKGLLIKVGYKNHN